MNPDSAKQLASKERKDLKEEFPVCYVIFRG